jgi:hypothetical protein
MRVVLILFAALALASAAAPAGPVTKSEAKRELKDAKQEEVCVVAFVPRVVLCVLFAHPTKQQNAYAALLKEVEQMEKEVLAKEPVVAAKAKARRLFRLLCSSDD